jgi:patatin-like phospholipase/acyl hydrolase
MSNISYPLIDGGVFVNNPTLCAYSEARGYNFGPNKKNKPTAKDMLILSLGTGNVDNPYPYKKAKDWGVAGWIKPLIDIMMSGVSETVDYQLHQIFDSVNCSDQYLRINPGLGLASPEMDNATEENLTALEEAGAECASDNYNKLTEFAQQLITNKL